MIIFDENISPYVFDNIHTPTNIEYFYTLNTNVLDFVLSPLLVLEELISPALVLEFNNFQIKLPTSYHVLVYDEETSQVDTIKVAELPNCDFPLFVYNAKTDKQVKIPYKIVDFVQEMTFTVPFLDKSQFLCHPVAPNTWIHVTSQDQYKKIENLVIGDFFA